MLLEVKNLSAALEDGKQILNDLSLCIDKGETHVLMGPNGAGKSSLGNTLMGNPVYRVTGGKIFICYWSGIFDLGNYGNGYCD